MDVTVLNEQEQKLLNRKDFKIRVAHKGATPGRAKLQEALASNLKTKKELVVIRQIMPEFGSASSVLDASVYKDVESIKRYEQAWVVKRHEKPAKEEAPAEAPAEETPAKEEPKAEEKKEASADDSKKEDSKVEPKVEEKKEEKGAEE